MTRKPFIMTILTACLATAAMLAAPHATASGSHGGNYDCSQNHQYIYKARYISAAHMQIFSYFDSYVTGLVEEAIRDLEDNAGGDFTALHTIASTAEMHLGWEAKEAEHYLRHVYRRKIKRNLHRCPVIFGRSAAENTGMKRKVSLRQVELRDQLDAALAAALAGGE